MNLEAQVGRHIVIVVSDTGTGIPPEVVGRIFEPFFTTKPLGQGAGLGISRVNAIVRSHGGFINVYSEVGKGTQVKVYLPAVKSLETQPVDEIELPVGQVELILVVDDEPSIREITKTSLETYNYRVLTATDGIEGVAIYTQHKDEISVVLMDMLMPSMDGPMVIRMLQKMSPQAKVIAVSGFATSDKVAELASIGVSTFLSKPYTAGELLEVLHGQLNNLPKSTP